MAKKKVVKVVEKEAVKKEEPEVRSGIKELSQGELSFEVLVRLSKLERRIDRIIEAHEKCKSLRGL